MWEISHQCDKNKSKSDEWQTNCPDLVIHVEVKGQRGQILKAAGRHRGRYLCICL